MTKFSDYTGGNLSGERFEASERDDFSANTIFPFTELQSECLRELAKSDGEISRKLQEQIKTARLLERNAVETILTNGGEAKFKRVRELFYEDGVFLISRDETRCWVGIPSENIARFTEGVYRSLDLESARHLLFALALDNWTVIIADRTAARQIYYRSKERGITGNLMLRGAALGLLFCVITGIIRDFNPVFTLFLGGICAAVIAYYLNRYFQSRRSISLRRRQAETRGAETAVYVSITRTFDE